MRVFIEQVLTKRLLKTADAWVELTAEAHGFANSGDAIEYCVAHGLSGVRLLMAFEDPAQDFYLDPFKSAEAVAEIVPLMAHNKDPQRQQWALQPQGDALAMPKPAHPRQSPQPVAGQASAA